MDWANKSPVQPHGALVDKLANISRPLHKTESFESNRLAGSNLAHVSVHPLDALERERACRLRK